MQWILAWSNGPQMIKSLQTGAPLCCPQHPPLDISHTNHLKWVSVLQWIISSPGQQEVAIKRGLLATCWINIRNWAIGDVMWCGADDPTADSASLETRNQKTPDPLNRTLSNFPLILQRPQTHTDTSHHHDHLPPPPPVEPLLNSGKTIPAHHTSISN